MNQDEKTLDIAEAWAMWNKDLFLHIKRDVEAPTVQLKQAEARDGEEEEEEENVPTIPITEPRSSREKETKPEERCRFCPRKTKEKSHA